MNRIAPSLLAANFTKLAEEVHALGSSTDILHLDIMDGHFVPNISFGPAIIKQLRPLTSLYFDVHLMISSPISYLEAFKSAGAQGITVHVETFASVAEGIALLKQIQSLGCDAGITLKPKTPVTALLPYLPYVQRVLIMTVEPGFGGQSFMHDQLAKISFVASYRHEHHATFDIEVDGGVNVATAKLCREAGALTLVAGTSVFAAKDYHQAIEEMRNA